MMYIQHNKDAPHMMHMIQKGTVGAEIGVWMGNTSQRFIQQGVKELHLVDAYSVEPYKNNSEMSFQDYISKYSKITGEFSEAGFTNYYDSVYESVKERFKKYSHVKLNRMPSSKWFAENKDLKLDWIYIDGDHSYEGCLADLEAALPMIKKGGMILGDDYGWPNARYQKVGVTKAVNEFRKKHKFPNDSFWKFGETQFMLRIK